MIRGLKSSSPQIPSRTRVVGPDRRVSIPAQLVPWLPEARHGELRTAHLFPLCWWQQEALPPPHQHGVWALADLDGDSPELSFDDWEISPDHLREAAGSETKLVLLARLILPIELRCREERNASIVWRFGIPEELHNAGCLPKHPDKVVLAPAPGFLTIWRQAAWAACDPKWPIRLQAGLDTPS